MSRTQPQSLIDLVQSAISELSPDFAAQSPGEQNSQVELAAGAVAHFLLEDADEELGEFRGILSALQAGATGAVWQVIERYEPHVQRVVRRRLSQQLRSRYDTMDFVQMVWKSFFEEPDRIQEFEHPKQLFGFLARMAQRKVDTEFRRRTATEKHDIAKEESLDQTSSDPRRLVDSPSQIAIARERWDRMLEDLPPRHRQVVRLRLQGLTFEQISERLSLDERTARRVLKRLLDAEDEDGDDQKHGTG